MQKSDVQTEKTLKIKTVCQSWHFRYSRIRCFHACSILHNSVNYTASKMKYAYFISVSFAIFDTTWDFL